MPSIPVASIDTVASRPEGEDSQELIAQLHEKIGQLTVEADWLKKKCKQLGL
jgi:hypothetical protein